MHTASPSVPAREPQRKRTCLDLSWFSCEEDRVQAYGAHTFKKPQGTCLVALLGHFCRNEQTTNTAMAAHPSSKARRTTPAGGARHARQGFAALCLAQGPFVAPM